ncbi:unnamed protein product [Tuber melanosporum]|uniref:(Perigord truffle) hypothetical protein n=1 Tax=Tuber melanosporum (strain Mel28) TaxID=656061 RepID=D5GMQ0_TUBMM|nr:uncharacterized protein GSTUM_00010876001 [Tuber melanosporum]CAZ85793.1 unnamed protein product [Tuber melanosporum]
MSQLSGVNSIKIGIDFGTTYSGIAWAYSSTPEKVNVVGKWVAGRSRTSGKAPSEIAYTSSGVKWGFGIPIKEPTLTWFKLLLDPTKYPLANSTNSPLARTKQLIPHGKNPVDVVADYLSELYKHTINHLEKTLGKSTVEVSPLDFVLTVPAVWSDAAKNLTLQAAELAGFRRKKSIRLISEPEAAAVCCLKEMEPKNLNVGDTFVVADCGGGTVDVISYTITRKFPKLEVVECVEGTGGLCGSTVLNERFEELVRDRIGDRFSRFDKMKHEGRVYMMKEFNDSLKRNFTDSEDEDLFTCPVPGIADDPTAGIEAGMFIIDRDDMRKIFNPVVQKVAQLVQQQVDEVEKLMTRQVKALLLVGGFGESEYLRSRLQAEIRTRSGSEISILQPPNAWTAVVRGAVMRGLEGEMVRIRKVARNYGNSCSVPFMEGYHPKRDGYIDPHDGEYMCRNRMRWYIRKFRARMSKRATRLDIHFVSIKSPIILTLPADVNPVCTLEVDPNVIPREKFKRKIGINGLPYFKLNFDLLMSIQSASILFEFDVDGTIYRDVKAFYHYA